MTESSEIRGAGTSVIRRRRFLQATTAIGAGIAAPAIISRKALSSSGELNLYSWSDYVYPEMIDSFESSCSPSVPSTSTIVP